ncbi:hypothetical protein [Micromonospora sp. WMMD964]|uniref:hypothetical protein n=1 Tax=Micromonospora sp. WMMD964 TaxID=3016091 RepID=UPI00249CAD09|nr:hypothetical protein [Micromonospora sp. WMMD964]WFF04484.1 hypothetical protein O7616_25640 [Micromonospora sp. WMMD964]
MTPLRHKRPDGGSRLCWGDERVDQEVAHYVARVRAERAAHEQPDDAAADAFRLDPPDVVPAVTVAA